MNKNAKRGFIILSFIIFILMITFVYKEYLPLRQFKNDNDIKNLEYHANSIEEVNKLKEVGKPMIIVFGADYCPTCVNYEPYIKELYLKYGDDIVIRHIDTVEHKDVREQYNIELIPSTIFYDKNGKAFLPNDEIEVYEPEETVTERKYISENIKPVNGEELNKNKYFEFGIENQTNEIVYSKYVGLIDMVQLEKIVDELLK